jgi:hypothetical protein
VEHNVADQTSGGRKREVLRKLSATPGVPPADQRPDLAAFIVEVGDTKVEVRAPKPQSFIYISGWRGRLVLA